MKYCFHICHRPIVLVVLWFFKSAKLLGAPRTLGALDFVGCPAQLIGCDATGARGTTGNMDGLFKAAHAYAWQAIIMGIMFYQCSFVFFSNATLGGYQRNTAELCHMFGIEI